ncbi:hypothetical protein [Catellatospora tritici]|uniref:hypothetical protein n=1 Tax=Catellatospora tritici TaxID=2851566 RepID=UPI001C2CFD61|nr:hypothetical protein [Catellatospora tritici]MBV1854619.1 hypothetical protein [Catellatospora tritici]
MNAGLAPVIAATTHWLTRTYPAAGGPAEAARVLAQARQAVTVAAWLRYPTVMDAGLLAMVGPGGSGGLDRVVHLDEPDDDADRVWRGWVDEVVASWAACLLADPRLAADAVTATADCEHAQVVPRDFTRLTKPAPEDVRAAALLRHPDLVGPIADLHRDNLIERLRLDPAELV